MERRYIAAIAVVVIVVAGGFGVSRWRVSRAESEAPHVQTAKVEVGTVAPTLAITGYVFSSDKREINSTGSGPVLEVIATVGETVSAGDALLKVERGTAGQTVNIAYADLTAARARLQDLLGQEASDDEIATQEAVLDEAQDEYSRSVENRYSTTIYSPIDGTVIAVSARIGDEPGGGSSGSAAGGAQSTGLVTVADLHRLQVEAAIDQADISKIAVDQTVDLTLDALPRKKFTGKVVSIDPIPQTSQNVVTYNVYVSIDEFDSGMRLGMSSNLEIALEKHEDVLYVPNVVIRTRGDEQYVTKMVDGTPTEVAVKTGLVASDRTEIISGLREGDEIVTQSFTAADGQSQRGSFGGGGFGGPVGGGNFSRFGGGRR